MNKVNKPASVKLLKKLCVKAKLCTHSSDCPNKKLSLLFDIYF